MASALSNPTGVRTARRRVPRGVWLGAGLLVVAGLLAALTARGVLWPNRLPATAYDVRGVDVSAYQGAIDWDVLADQDVEFAYIKATEGSGFQDERFAENWDEATATDLLVGAYHFFSFESPGESQARNVIETVPVRPGSLPPVVDLEFYGDFARNPPSAQAVRRILDPLLADLEAHHGVPPVLYATADSYDAYLRGGYPRNPVWIRSVLTPASLPDGRDWTFWQYSNRDRLPGYRGEEEYIDMNVFVGSLDDLRALCL